MFDPWNKPEARGLHGYGQEGVDTDKDREKWIFENSIDGAKTRAKLTGRYWETLHIDLRMVDTADFLVAHCPTNVYSVGTVHEIALARQQRKPVLFVSRKSLFTPGKAIRGGVPIIFPWFGSRSDGKPGPDHGFARTSEWAIEGTSQRDDGNVEIAFTLSPNDITRGFGYAAFRVRFRVTVTPDPLLDVRFAASSWGYALKSACFDLPALGAFMDAHYAMAPENSCYDDNFDPTSPDAGIPADCGQEPADAGTD